MFKYKYKYFGFLPYLSIVPYFVLYFCSIIGYIYIKTKYDYWFLIIPYLESIII